MEIADDMQVIWETELGLFYILYLKYFFKLETLVI